MAKIPTEKRSIPIVPKVFLTKMADGSLKPPNGFPVGHMTGGPSGYF